MNFHRTSNKADQLRAIPLPWVLRVWGAVPDPHDRNKWHTSRGTLSLKGPKFINWNHGKGGGGAIDLVIHLKDCCFREALHWLQHHFPQHSINDLDPSAPSSAFNLPASDPLQLGRVKDYLTTERALPLILIQSLIATGTLYADPRANAVFLLRDTQGSVVGAELRGTTCRHWRGMAAGSRKNLGFFSIPTDLLTCDQRPIILCESAIDAISALALHPQHRCLSTAGARPNPAWLGPFIQKGARVYCGFDADDTGERMAQAMIGFYPSVTRLRPNRHDWNDLLKSPK